VNSDLWFGAVTTLAGAGLGGAISLALNRQQLKGARAQRAIVSTMSRAQGFLKDPGSRTGDDPWRGLNDEMAGLLRRFQLATREELGIGGVDPRRILDRG